VLKLLDHNFKGLGKVLEGCLGIAVGFVLKGQLHLALLAKHDDVLLVQRFEVNLARNELVVLHSKYHKFETFLCKVRDGMATLSPAGRHVQLSHN
jgi:hypothetical protein